MTGACPSSPVEYHDRYSDEVRTESIYGESSLRWAYETSLGRLTTRAIVKRAVFSRFYGWLMSRPASREKIQPFIERYGIDPDEFRLAPGEFGSFNEFFHRELKPEARPVDLAPDHIVFPADGRHLGIPDLSRNDGFFVKGQRFDLESFLGDRVLAERYRRGAFVLSRLCPVDYHRFHYPAGGVPGLPEKIEGPLYSVNPIALRRNLDILATNRRFLTSLETASAGTILMVEIGATNVGSVIQTSAPGASVAKGAEKGYFQFGGSAIATIFEPERVALAPDLVENTARHRELYARMGDFLGAVVNR